MSENEQPQAKDEYRLTPDATKYYANNIRFETNPFDLTILFGELAGNLPGGNGSLVEQKVAVKISWLQAKIMAIFLAINVADHEQGAGALRIPKFVFAAPLKHLGDADLTLEQMVDEILKVVSEQKKALEKS